MHKVWTNNELIEALCSKSDSALLAIFETYSEDLLNYFIPKYKILSKEDISSFITDSMIKLVDYPEKYNKEKTSLKTYLIRDIRGDIINSLQKKRLSVVELVEEIGNNENENIFEIEEQETQIRDFLKSIFKNEIDCQVAWMIEIDKLSKTEDYIELLQLQNLVYAQQQEEVKRYKDRIIAQLRRKCWKDFLKTLQ